MLYIVRDFLIILISKINIKNFFSIVQNICYYRYNYLILKIFKFLIIQITIDIFFFCKNYCFFFNNNKYKKTDSRISENKFEKLSSYFINNIKN